jgi:hypothetical protein
MAPSRRSMLPAEIASPLMRLWLSSNKLWLFIELKSNSIRLRLIDGALS